MACVGGVGAGWGVDGPVGGAGGDGGGAWARGGWRFGVAGGCGGGAGGGEDGRVGEASGAVQALLLACEQTGAQAFATDHGIEVEATRESVFVSPHDGAVFFGQAEVDADGRLTVVTRVVPGALDRFVPGGNGPVVRERPLVVGLSQEEVLAHPGPWVRRMDTDMDTGMDVDEEASPAAAAGGGGSVVVFPDGAALPADDFGRVREQARVVQGGALPWFVVPVTGRFPDEVRNLVTALLDGGRVPAGAVIVLYPSAGVRLEPGTVAAVARLRLGRPGGAGVRVGPVAVFERDLTEPMTPSWFSETTGPRLSRYHVVRVDFAGRPTFRGFGYQIWFFPVSDSAFARLGYVDETGLGGTPYRLWDDVLLPRYPGAADRQRRERLVRWRSSLWQAYEYDRSWVFLERARPSPVRGDPYDRLVWLRQPGLLPDEDINDSLTVRPDLGPPGFVRLDEPGVVVMVVQTPTLFSWTRRQLADAGVAALSPRGVTSPAILFGLFLNDAFPPAALGRERVVEVVVHGWPGGFNSTVVMRHSAEGEWWPVRMNDLMPDPPSGRDPQVALRASSNPAEVESWYRLLVAWNEIRLMVEADGSGEEALRWRARADELARDWNGPGVAMGERVQELVAVGQRLARLTTAVPRFGDRVLLAHTQLLLLNVARGQPGGQLADVEVPVDGAHLPAEPMGLYSLVSAFLLARDLINAQIQLLPEPSRPDLRSPTRPRTSGRPGSLVSPGEPKAWPGICRPLCARDKPTAGETCACSTRCASCWPTMPPRRTAG